MDFAMMSDHTSPSLTSHLFTVRVWREELGDDRVEWRGKVQYALSGEARYFREWTELIAFVREQAGDSDQAGKV
jgi:hypothetical protein